MTKTKTSVARTGDTQIQVNEETGKLELHWPCLVIEGMRTGDGRLIPYGSLGHRGLPLPVMGQSKTGKGHDGAEVFGHITRLERVEGPTVVSKETGEPFPEGTAVWQAWGEGDPESEPGKLALSGYLTGNSADLADTQTIEELADEDGKTTVEMRGGKIAGTTLVPVPAFADGYVEVNGERVEREPAVDALVASGVGFTGDTDDDGYVAFAAPTAEKRREAEKSGHAMKGGRFPIDNVQDLHNAIRAVGRAKGGEAERAAVRRHIMAQARRLGAQDAIPDSWNSDGSLKLDADVVAWRIVDSPVLTADASEDAFRPPLHLFQPRHLTGVTPLTLERLPDGTLAVYGHAADFNRPHISFSGRRVMARPSPSGYAKGFNTGALRVLDEAGEERTVAVGRLTYGEGHAPTDAGVGAREAKAFYDDPGKAWAWVQASDDQYGVQVNGVVIPGTPDDRVTRALAHPVSGDWRPIDGQLELVAAHCVNTAGFPVPRQLVASGEVMALVAAGAVAPAPNNPVVLADRIADFVLDRLAERLPGVLASLEPDRDLAAERDALALEFHRDDLLAELTEPRVGMTGWQLDLLPTMTQLATLEPELAADLGRWHRLDPAAEHQYSHDLLILGDLEDRESLANWVTKAGGLPGYIKRIEKHLMSKGMGESQAIATAVNVAKKMCATGDVNWPGKQQVNAGSRAEACAAVASWEAKKASA